MLKLLNLKTVDLNKNLIEEILRLKDTHWKKGITSQRKYFKENVYKNDLHLLLYFNDSLSGYVLLRNRKCTFKKKNIPYFHFDTLIIKKNLRKKELSSFLMNFVGNFIKFKNSISILYCSNKVVKYYKKFGWKKGNYRDFILKIKKPKNKNILIYK
tara:strand:- start:70 stop:537 length:468 start_codon:yes stop_codon:yes gene_type:complete